MEMECMTFQQKEQTPQPTPHQRTLTIGGSITVRLTYCLTGLELAKQVKLFFVHLHRHFCFLCRKTMSRLFEPHNLVSLSILGTMYNCT